MYQHILVPVDGSATSDRALQEAIRLARQQSAQLELVHVVEDIRLLDSDSYINYAEMQETVRNSGKKTLAHAQMVVQLTGMGAEINLLEAHGKRIASIIVEEAERWPADLIVIGTHGRSGFSRVLFGSVAEGVVRTAHIPVLLIRGA
ncbi:nucleotide-binding universal stress UspA family protein [Nitrosospira sp. Nsp5]|jgi:nucleotide-binding universal stress UspA family protein|uniref:Universal stress protein n=1 Tax=Nitrosospira multiformis TaxID=1231 RepID=A0ABY0TL11_9PROT|nr:MULTISPECIES: universal stress protein [Nitrosospira]PTR05305.1 nucleotide-binding universal stress UspA family protein [Nitrosospira sp. Nsp5]SDQ91193.1 Nucleotide-binding universal stress protein, UspA family [Nitrosospira multiformis]